MSTQSRTTLTVELEVRYQIQALLLVALLSPYLWSATEFEQITHLEAGPHLQLEQL